MQSENSALLGGRYSEVAAYLPGEIVADLRVSWDR